MHTTNTQALSALFCPKPLPLNNSGLPRITETTVLTVNKQATGGENRLIQRRDKATCQLLSDRMIVK